jgi:hypothetical protein
MARNRDTGQCVSSGGGGSPPIFRFVDIDIGGGVVFGATTAINLNGIHNALEMSGAAHRQRESFPSEPASELEAKRPTPQPKTTVMGGGGGEMIKAASGFDPFGNNDAIHLCRSSLAGGGRAVPTTNNDAASAAVNDSPRPRCQELTESMSEVIDLVTPPKSMSEAIDLVTPTKPQARRSALLSQAAVAESLTKRHASCLEVDSCISKPRKKPLSGKENLGLVSKNTTDVKSSIAKIEMKPRAVSFSPEDNRKTFEHHYPRAHSAIKSHADLFFEITGVKAYSTTCPPEKMLEGLVENGYTKVFGGHYPPSHEEGNPYSYVGKDGRALDHTTFLTERAFIKSLLSYQVILTWKYSWF